MPHPRSFFVIPIRCLRFFASLRMTRSETHERLDQMRPTHSFSLFVIPFFVIPFFYSPSFVLLPLCHSELALSLEGRSEESRAAESSRQRAEIVPLRE